MPSTLFHSSVQSSSGSIPASTLGAGRPSEVLLATAECPIGSVGGMDHPAVHFSTIFMAFFAIMTQTPQKVHYKGDAAGDEKSHRWFGHLLGGA